MAKNILQEAIAESKQIKEVAIANARSVLIDHFKDDIKSVVDKQLNEAHASDVQVGVDADYDQEDKLYEQDESCDEVEDDEKESDAMELEYMEELDLDLGADEDSEEEEEEVEESLSEMEDEEVTEATEGDDSEDEDEGLSEKDLDEAIAEALGELHEVTHGGLGDVEFIDPDSHPTGLMDEDGKEQNHDKKEPPAKKDWTVKEGLYQKRIAKLVKENLLHKKAVNVLKKNLNEVRLFNAQLYFTSKLMREHENLNEGLKKKII